MVALPFVVAGLETLRDPRPRAEQVAPRMKSIADRMDWLPTKDPEALVRAEGALSVGAGALLALGKFERLNSLLLATQLVPTLLSEHHYWAEDDPERRASERSHLLKNMSLFGALLIVATQPRRPSRMARRARDARVRAGAEARHLRKHAAGEAKKLARR